MWTRPRRVCSRLGWRARLRGHPHHSTLDRPGFAGTPPQLLIVVGPPAAGKSTLLPKAAGMLGLDLDTFVSVDGDDLRSIHGGWREVSTPQSTQQTWTSLHPHGSE